MIKHIPKKERTSIVEKVVNCDLEKIKQSVNEAFTELPGIWQLSPNLKDRILAFLLNKSRLYTINGELLLLILRPKK